MRYVSVVAMVAMLFAAGCKKGGKEKGEAESPKKPSESKKQGASAKKGESGSEHPGDEASGSEHPGDEASGSEHPGDEHPGDEAESKDSYSAADIKEAMKSHIDSETGDDGIFTIEDSKEGKELSLKFVKIHDPVRRVEGKGYFACTDFHVDGEKKKVYDLDFWLKPKDGELKVTKTKIHKHPVKKDGEWTKKARFTYKDDEPVKVE